MTNDILIWVWLSIFIFAVVFEALTVDFVAVWFAIGALPSFFISLFGGSIILQVFLFVTISIALLLYTRPFMMRYVKTNRISTNVDAHIGKTVLVTKKITKNTVGEVQLRSVTWSAIADENIEVGQEVRILDIEGTKFIVKSIKES
jgi:membrane protein implicated in regulation of membrane protease activity